MKVNMNCKKLSCMTEFGYTLLYGSAIHLKKSDERGIISRNVYFFIIVFKSILVVG